ncbi:hypothetical protein [Butyrivibrio sp. VCD2006]|uniref:hypothetical protein n=1 Tax=Butyrivibrio sp. VCD2006 TaxID=1280664 RepID=UPI0012DE5E7A|nr:hypothetical protein [Butyrivibrio sp. VCD2006]
MEKENLFKRIVSTVLATALIVGSAAFTPEFATEAHAEAFTPCNISMVANAENGNNTPGIFTMPTKVQHESRENKPYPKDQKGYFKFTLAEDSWVYFALSTSDHGEDDINVTTKLYGDENMSNQIAEVKYTYYNSKSTNASAFLKKGTYYGYVYAEFGALFGYFEGNVNVIGFGVPLKNCFNITQKKKKNKTIVKIDNALGQYSKYMQCIPKGVGSQSLYNDRIWKDSGRWWGDKKTKVLECNENNQYTFTVKKKSKKYTVMLEDMNGNRWQKTFKVKVKK